jgi:Cathepsin propeptide inhibitor domain (I29)
VKDTSEYNKRKQRFDDNFNKVKAFNNKTGGKEKFKLGINELSDWSPEEITAILSYKPVVDRPVKGNATFPPNSKRFLATFNASIDWRD